MDSPQFHEIGAIIEHNKWMLSFIKIGNDSNDTTVYANRFGVSSKSNGKLKQSIR